MVDRGGKAPKQLALDDAECRVSLARGLLKLVLGGQGQARATGGSASSPPLLAIAPLAKQKKLYEEAIQAGLLDKVGEEKVGQTHHPVVRAGQEAPMWLMTQAPGEIVQLEIETKLRDCVTIARAVATLRRCAAVGPDVDVALGEIRGLLQKTVPPSPALDKKITSAEKALDQMAKTVRGKLSLSDPARQALLPGDAQALEQCLANAAERVERELQRVAFTIQASERARRLQEYVDQACGEAVQALMGVERATGHAKTTAAVVHSRDVQGALQRAYERHVEQDGFREVLIVPLIGGLLQEGYSREEILEWLSRESTRREWTLRPAPASDVIDVDSLPRIAGVRTYTIERGR